LLLQYCEDTYNSLSAILESILLLPTNPTDDDLMKAQLMAQEISGDRAYIALRKICSHLAVLADYDNETKIGRSDAEYRLRSIARRISDLNVGPAQFSNGVADFRWLILSGLATADMTRNTEELKANAMKARSEIDQALASIAQTVHQLEGTASDGAEAILNMEEVAVKALQRPERMLILSMFFVVFIFALGALSFQYLKFYQFALVTGFALTAVIVLNAFYLRTIDKLSEESFLKLIELALLKFFAPLTRRKEKRVEKEIKQKG
jgi:hypothetical protein